MGCTHLFTLRSRVTFKTGKTRWALNNNSTSYKSILLRKGSQSEEKETVMTSMKGTGEQEIKARERERCENEMLQ